MGFWKQVKISDLLMPGLPGAFSGNCDKFEIRDRSGTIGSGNKPTEGLTLCIHVQVVVIVGG